MYAAADAQKAPRQAAAAGADATCSTPKHGLLTGSAASALAAVLPQVGPAKKDFNKSFFATQVPIGTQTASHASVRCNPVLSKIDTAPGLLGYLARAGHMPSQALSMLLAF